MDEHRKQLKALAITFFSIVVCGFAFYYSGYFLDLLVIDVESPKAAFTFAGQPPQEAHVSQIGRNSAAFIALLILSIISFVFALMGVKRCFKSTSKDSKIVNYSAKSLGLLVVLLVLGMIGFNVWISGK